MSSFESSRSQPQVWNFMSEPDLHPMRVTVNVNKPGTAPGFIFVGPGQRAGNVMQGALIMDQLGNPVWFRPLEGGLTNTDFRVQTYKGKPVLTMWQGELESFLLGLPAPGAFFLIFNQNYQVIKRLKARKGFISDVHEFTITKRNTALFIGIKKVPADLTPFGGPKQGVIINDAIQEVDLKTGKLLFMWEALTHVSPTESMLPASSAAEEDNIWDPYHTNSLQEGPDDTLLVSMRNMWTIFCIDKKTGNILWRLGGKRSDFTFGPNATFSWQHNARLLPGNRISLFDNSCCASPTTLPEGVTHGLILKLDLKRMRANVDRTYFHAPPLISTVAGNVQNLENGNKFIGWGAESYLSEYRGNGNTPANPKENFIYDMKFPDRIGSYRAFKNKWVGLPLNPPSIAVDLFGNAAVVYASWNGSTETVAWRVLAGMTPQTVSVVRKSASRKGFETAIVVESGGPYFQVKALDSSSKVIGTSGVVRAVE
ncbi:arylsulfotransferase family protein [Mechercharimyces sp. CAU 1602]|uniref:arylsulfotransferase family protein n=1 Tax=Mechercharimyces sp. CAU 1602 TaxID=2973933 RepID=UPI0021628672|nr:arylsulfotransferase family protein [Mechercharimyces sp. CAU 1602]MCS1350459.1 arylsulfotransferase family protein [Mechercharimyces sp. CAU 1602]